jgi:DNA-binding Lrp family transcriptional regulator
MNRRVEGLKKHELGLMAELLKDSCRSDREIARAMGISQPTVSRAKAKLEKEGYISEHTVIPNFNKLGYHLFALTFFKWKRGLTEEERSQARKWAIQKAPSVPNNVVLIERGMGLGFDSFMASFHEDYSSYAKLKEEITRMMPFVSFENMESFIVDLDDKVHYRYLTFAVLAKHLMEKEERRKGVEP